MGTNETNRRLAYEKKLQDILAEQFEKVFDRTAIDTVANLTLDTDLSKENIASIAGVSVEYVEWIQKQLKK